MTARDERLGHQISCPLCAAEFERLCEQGIGPNDIERLDARHRAEHAAPAASPVGADPLRDEIAARYGADKVIALEQIMGASATVEADPPWLGEAAYEARKAWSPHAVGPLEEDTAYWRGWMTIARAVLRFAAAQPPSAEEIEAAGKEIVARLHLEELSLDTEQRIARAALLAAARVRAGG